MSVIMSAENKATEKRKKFAKILKCRNFGLSRQLPEFGSAESVIFVTNISSRYAICGVKVLLYIGRPNGYPRMPSYATYKLL